ncbi:hypothetical protein [Streptomyces sp. NPDC059994]|uniref:hypothetical protein n=1 Tax=Streptomyces sp. NPDC059994 TaxID=3347029 RepID=UPI00367F9BA7
MLGRYVCGAKSVVHDSALLDALTELGEYWLAHQDRVESQTVTCKLEHSGSGPHWAVVLGDGEWGSAVWAVWMGNQEPDSFAELADCPALSDNETPCGLFLLHPGGHTWEVSDPENEMWEAIAPALYYAQFGHYGPFTT